MLAAPVSNGGVMQRREFFAGMAAMPVLAAQEYAHRTRGLPPLTIRDVRVITTGAGRGYQWVFVKVMTSEPGLYGLGSASNLGQALTVATAIEKYYAPFWTGKDPARIEDLWQSTNVRCYWRNSTMLNNARSALDMALWDIKGKRAGMPVYDLLGGKARDAVPLYAHADGRDAAEVEDHVRKYMEEGYRHVRAQLGGYGGGGFIAPGHGSRPHPDNSAVRLAETLAKLARWERPRSLGREATDFLARLHAGGLIPSVDDRATRPWRSADPLNVNANITKPFAVATIAVICWRSDMVDVVQSVPSVERHSRLSEPDGVLAGRRGPIASRRPPCAASQPMSSPALGRSGIRPSPSKSSRASSSERSSGGTIASEPRRSSSGTRLPFRRTASDIRRSNSPSFSSSPRAAA